MKLVRIKSVKPLKDFIVELKFTDETSKQINLEPFLRGKIFEPMRSDRKIFESVKVDEQSGTIAWENGADIDPDVLYHNMKPAWAEEKELELTK